MILVECDASYYDVVVEYLNYIIWSVPVQHVAIDEQIIILDPYFALSYLLG